ncbi:hypothetical protein DL98DRAFT_516751 [Cadophora sp. DSE1049]|nr:hypothetical protein DL98DRAFT_516751 [Cadophora sp. DSE1049]
MVYMPPAICHVEHRTHIASPSHNKKPNWYILLFSFLRLFLLILLSLFPAPNFSSLIINQTPRAPTPTTAPADTTARHGYQVVDAECYQGEHEEEDDDYYSDYVVLFDHFGGLILFVWIWFGEGLGEIGRAMGRVRDGGGNCVEGRMVFCGRRIC